MAALTVLSGYAPVLAQQTVGLFLNSEGAFDGFTLFAPQNSGTTYLINNEGKQVHSWDSAFLPGNTAYLLENGNLLRTAKDAPPEVPRFMAGGFGGRVEELAWDGTVIWSYLYADFKHRQHHDIEPLPNGNVLLVAWELKTAEEAVAAGRDPLLLADGELWPDHIIEVQPVGFSGGIIVWEWHLWDHLIQDLDPTKNNFGVVADHPELIDVNFIRPGTPGRADWNHMNAVDYNETFDQILLGVPFFGEFWVIDHSTTTQEASGHSGGRSGKGGDILYRWGNPAVYDRGGPEDQRLFNQHHPHWIEPGLSGAGNILIFNNGRGRPDGDYSSVDEIVPPIDAQGSYELLPGLAFGPDGPIWSYTADPPASLFSGGLSGAQRLPNQNTLICEGRPGNFFEVTPAEVTVWRYVNPVTNLGATAQGDPVVANNVFRILRYPVDYSGFDGQTLTPGDPVEQFNRPLPAPDGTGATLPLTASRVTAQGDSIQVTWDAGTCAAFDHNLLFGNLVDVSSHNLQGADCNLGITGNYDWSNVPGGSLFFLVVGVDDTGVYESSWGSDSSGAERNATTPSGLCGVTNKDVTESCP